MISRPADPSWGTVQTLLDDAWEQYRSALERLNAGDVGTPAAKPGTPHERPRKQPCWRTAATPRPPLTFPRAFDPSPDSTACPACPPDTAQRAQYLHNDACYYGACDNDDIPDLIYSTEDFIRAAQELAQHQEG